MINALEVAIDRLALLPDDEQERIAKWLAAELDDETRWQTCFKDSVSMLRQMADKAFEEFGRGETKPMTS